VEEEGLSPAEVLAFLEKRRAVLGGLVISGGEPCLWGELPDFIGAVKKTGLRVKIDTNGTVPAMLEGLLRRGESRPDYLALDLKLAPARYGELLPPGGGEGGAGGPGAALEKSAALLRASGIAHEFRSIALPESFFTEHDVEALAPLVGGAPWYFRAFRGGNCLDPAWNGLEGGGAGAKILARKARDLGKNASTP
jgi:pyruvate formate lyase activating enzyme